MQAIGLNPLFTFSGMLSRDRETLGSPEAVLRRHGLVPFAQKWLVLRHIYAMAFLPEERLCYRIDFNLRTILWSASTVILALSYFVAPAFFVGFAPLAFTWMKSTDRMDPDNRNIRGWKFRLLDRPVELDRVWRVLPRVSHGHDQPLPPPAHFRRSMERAMEAASELPGAQAVVLTYEEDPILLVRVPLIPGLGVLSHMIGHRTFFVDFYGTGLQALDAHHLNR